MNGSPILVVAVLLNGAYSQVVDTNTAFHKMFFVQKTNPVTNTSYIQPAPFPSVGNSAPVRAGPLARGNNAQYAPTLPCCRDRFGEQACQSLSRSQPEIFERRCLADHDFNTLDCCAECRNYITTHNINAENTRTLMKAPQLCKDKHSLTFCRRFKLSGMGKFSCSNAEFAVRVCRHTCGYCNDNLYATAGQVPLCSKGTGVRKLRYAP